MDGLRLGLCVVFELAGSVGMGFGVGVWGVVEFLG